MEIFWDRVTLKERAKSALKGSYFSALIVMVLVAILGGGAISSVGSNSLRGSLSQLQNGGTLDPALITTLLSVSAVIVSVGLVYSIFVGSIFVIGKNNFFIKNAAGKGDVSDLFEGFKKNYKGKMITMLLYQLFIGLWSLLFVIPGIIAMYRYWMVPYILADNPDISWKRAFEISKETTNGEKAYIFVLGLSFIGWYLLGALACGVGVIFVGPYVEATYAELYGALKAKALTQNIATADDFGGNVGEEEDDPWSH